MSGFAFCRQTIAFDGQRASPVSIGPAMSMLNDSSGSLELSEKRTEHAG